MKTPIGEIHKVTETNLTMVSTRPLDTGALRRSFRVSPELLADTKPAQNQGTMWPVGMMPNTQFILLRSGMEQLAQMRTRGTLSLSQEEPILRDLNGVVSGGRRACHHGNRLVRCRKCPWVLRHGSWAIRRRPSGTGSATEHFGDTG